VSHDLTLDGKVGVVTVVALGGATIIHVPVDPAAPLVISLHVMETRVPSVPVSVSGPSDTSRWRDVNDVR
jgi:hypothetical protein